MSAKILYFRIKLIPLKEKEQSAEAPNFNSGGDEGIRTPDPLLAKQMLSQLSYIP